MTAEEFCRMRRDQYVKFSDEWMRWHKEIDRLRTTKPQGFTLQVNVKAPTVRRPWWKFWARPTLNDPKEVGRTIAAAINEYKRQNPGGLW